MKTNKTIIAGILTAFASSICCIIPLLIAVSGTATSLTSSIAWIETYRSYMIGLTILLFGYGFYEAYKSKPTKEDCCNSEKRKNTPPKLLWFSALFALLTMTFPYYENIFQTEKKVVDLVSNHTQKVNFKIEGMTCAGCENHINDKLSNLKGVTDYTTSYKLNNSVVAFDSSKITISEIESAINSTGYIIKNKLICQ